MPSFTPVVRQIVVHHSKRISFSLAEVLGLGLHLGLHADSSIRENAGRERGLCLAGFTATHLLRAGVDINTIRAWLGHVSIDTTNIYAESDLAMKAKALAMCEAPSRRNGKRWRDNPDLLAFLAQL